MSKKKDYSLIDELTNVIVTKTHTDPKWARMLAISLLSGVVGEKYVFPFFDGFIYLNIFATTLGPSGSGKSLPLNKIIIPIVNDLGIQFPDEFTVEGLTEAIIGELGTNGKRTGGKTSGMIIKDEISVLFNQPKFRKGTPEFLCKLWSSSPMSNRTRTHKLESIPATAISMIGTSTKAIYSSITADHFINGFLNRFLWVDFDLDIIRGHTKDELFPNQTHQKKGDQRLKKCTSMLKKIRSLKIQREKVQISDKAKDLFDKAETSLKQKSREVFREDPTDVLGGYYNHATANFAKLAGLFAISRQSENLGHTNHIVTVNSQDVRSAFDFLRDRIEDFKTIYVEWDYWRKNKPINADEIDIRKHIETNYKEGDLLSLKYISDTLNIDYTKTKNTCLSLEKTDPPLVRIDDSKKNNRYYRAKSSKSISKVPFKQTNKAQPVINNKKSEQKKIIEKWNIKT